MTTIWLLSISEMLILATKFMNTYKMASTGDAGMDKSLFSRIKGLPVLQEPTVADVSNTQLAIAECIMMRALLAP